VPLSTQVPVPSQVRASVSVLPEQEAAAHAVPEGCRRQAPAPSQVPSKPQVEADRVWQIPGGAAVPAGNGRHRPTAPGWSQDEQPAHWRSQHTPLAQCPLAHSAAVLHGAPVGRSLQAPSMHSFGAAHSASVVQNGTHAVPLQR
jgi:hypothetical protein